MKQLGRDILVYGLINLLARLTGLITSPFTTRLLTMSQYGAGPLLSAIWAPFSLLQFGGMDSAYPYLAARADSKQDHEIILATLSFIANFFTFLSITVFGIVILWGTWISDYASISYVELVLFVINLIPAGLVYWITYVLRFKREKKAFIKITCLAWVMPAILALPFIALFEQPDRLLASWSLSFFLQMICFVYALHVLWRHNLWPYFLKFFSKDIAKKALRYGIVLVPAAMIYSFGTVIDRLIVSWFLGVESVAILQLGLAIGGVALMVSHWFGMAFDPHLISWIADKTLDQQRKNLEKLAYVLALTISGMAIGAVIWSDWFFYLLYTKQYAASAELIPVLILAAIFPLLSRIATATILLKDKPFMFTYVFMLGFLVNLIVGLILVPKIGVIGAVIGTAVAECVIFTSWVVFGRLIYKNLLISWWPVYIMAGVTALIIMFSPSLSVGTPSGLLNALGLTCVLAIIYFVSLVKILGLQTAKKLISNPKIILS